MDFYRAPKVFPSSHLETIYPALFRRVRDVVYERERIFTPDEDFLDLDWLKAGSDHVVILSHGLEGDSNRPYIRGMARALHTRGIDVLAWNFRGCSGEINRLPRFYHSGATDDLETVIRHVINTGYKMISLIGFSLGGNLTLKYLGEHPNEDIISRAVAFSVPLALYESCLQISKPSNYVYSRRFLKSLKSKILQKSIVMPDKIDPAPLKSIRTLIDFDDIYTAPLHGFKDARDYYEKCSSLYFLDRITTPTLLINAANDPFLSPECYPEDPLARHPRITFKMPRQGGHVGFTLFNPEGIYWSEKQAVDFIGQPV